MSRKPKWGEIPAGKRAGIVLLASIQLSLLGAALWDIYHRPSVKIRGPKWLWTAISFINVFGPIAYFAVGRKRSD